MRLVEMRTIMAEEIRELHNRTGCPAHANAIANLCGKTLASIRLHLEYAKMRGEAIVLDLLEE
ncbi:MAG: hypothetical protein ACW99U_21440 [Candidatus Thorarchaeota archaeon]|jgi:hypothetical protein